MYEKYLEDLGLSDKEAKVYLALLSVDNDSVVDLSKKTKINRTTIYPVLESLAKKGLISEVKVDKKVRFQAEPPERLETYVERRRINLEEQSKKLKDVIPELKSVQREAGEKPIVKFYEGKEGVLSASSLLFANYEKNKKYYAVYSKDLLDEIFPEVTRKKYKKERLNKKINSKVVYGYSKGDLPSSKDGLRFKIDENKYPIKADIGVYGDVVKISTLGDKISSLLIKSSDVAITVRSLIDYIHDSSENNSK